MARELLIGVFATLAKYESQRRSDRIRVGPGAPQGRGQAGRPAARGEGQEAEEAQRVRCRLGSGRQAKGGMLIARNG